VVALPAECPQVARPEVCLALLLLEAAPGRRKARQPMPADASVDLAVVVAQVAPASAMNNGPPCSPA